jgi:RHS repeat-associated protein
MYYSDNWQVLEERQEDDSEWLLNKQYVWGIRYIDELILRDQDTSSPIDGTLNIRHYALQDANFNVVALVGSTGSVVRRYSYDAYGHSITLETDYSPGAYEYDFEYRYAGYRWDYETYLLQVRNRWYHPRLGRWVSRDPIGYAAGDANLYRYVGNSPVTWSDPLGLFEISIAFNAFIPRTKGTVLLGVEDGIPSVNWGVVPGQLPFKSQYRYFSTDNRYRAGESGTSKISLKGQFDSCQIGSLQPLVGQLFEAKTGISHQLEAYNARDALGPIYVRNSKETKRATPSKYERGGDTSKRTTRIETGAGASYPFSSFAPSINLDMSFAITRYRDGSVGLIITGSHNEFPAYEIIVNGKVVYEDYPTSSGPGLGNLGLFWDDFGFRVTIDKDGVVQTQ